MKILKLSILSTSLLCVGLLVAVPALADQSALPTKPQEQSATAESVQSEVEARAADAAAEKRKRLAADAFTALSETKNALKLLAEKKNDEALEALATVTGKLELIVARDPELALAPVDVQVITHDVLADLDTVKAVIKEAREALDDGEIQKARPLVAALASEIVFSTSNIPLATYPDAIKDITPLIDAGKIDEAKKALQVELNTLVITNEVVPLPTLRAEVMLKQAEELAEKKERTQEENDNLANLLTGSHDQLQLAEALGYGKKKSFKPIYEQIEKIEKQTAGGKSGKGWFDKVKQQVSDLMQ